MKLVIVESPSKAKTINKYLGKDYYVMASFGHIRDVPSKSGAVDVENNFALTWESNDRSKKHVSDIITQAKKAEEVLLATDPDREGEAIAWHIADVLHEKKLNKVPLKRVVFYEITKTAVNAAISAPRNINDDLVNAYKARRTLDYLMGFTLSPVLWRKLPGSRSAGRVQSVALKLVAERENEIEMFEPQEYWSIDGEFFKEVKHPFNAQLALYKGEKLEKFSFTNEKESANVVENLKGLNYSVETLEKKKAQRKPQAPFTTSTMQQEASKRLGFGAARTMRVAQKLYEGIDINGTTQGLITYMRTDSVNLAAEAVNNIRGYINSNFAKEYMPAKAITYATKSKNAQEAHEAIRPTNVSLAPAEVKPFLDADQFRLYELIWKRAVACQMTNAQYDRLTVWIAASEGDHKFKATGSTLRFDGFLTLYNDTKDSDSGTGFADSLLPPLNEGDVLTLKDLVGNQHFTQPPARYTEASLIKTLEEKGIGRPSTYASIIQVLQDRNYVTLDKKRFFSTDRGRLVAAFLNHYFTSYVDYDFTANLEEDLDKISNGDTNYLGVLKKFWKGLDEVSKEALKLKTSEMLEVLNNDLAFILFPKNEDGTFDRSCKACGKGTLSLKVGKFGAFIGCSDYPECKFTRPFDKEDTSAEAAPQAEDKVLGAHPETQKDVLLKRGPYGWYVETEFDKVKRVTLPKDLIPDEVNLDTATFLLTLPRTLGQHPETGKDVKINNGRFGPYAQHQKTFASLGKKYSLFEVTFDEALELVEAKEKSPAKKAVKRTTTKKTAAKKK